VLCPKCAGSPSTVRRTGGASRFFRGPGSSRPVVTYTLIAINILIYLLQLIPGLNVTSALLYSPYYSLGEYAAAGAPYEPWRMITAMFAHSPTSFLHILFNMFTLWMFGQVLESILGRARFFTLYMIAGLAGSLGVLYFDLALGLQFSSVVGASGAIFGLMGAYLVILRHLGSNSTGLLVLVGINVVLGFLPGSNLSWQAHVGGLIGGIVVGLIYTRTRSREKLRLQRYLIGAVVAVELVAALAHAPIFVS
jgi:membrane associated rhomboid family serine protease